MAKVRMNKVTTYHDEDFYRVSLEADMKDPDHPDQNIDVEIVFRLTKTTGNISEIEERALEKAKKFIEQLEF